MDDFYRMFGPPSVVLLGLAGWILGFGYGGWMWVLATVLFVLAGALAWWTTRAIDNAAKYRN